MVYFCRYNKLILIVSGPEGSSTTAIKSCVYHFLYLQFMVHDDNYYMNKAIRLGQKAASIDEVPVGCVIVYHDQIIAKAYNKKEHSQQAIDHAEVRAIQQASRKLKSWRLEDCTLYVTLEPCMMCMGAIIQSRISKVVYGASDPKGGCAHTVIDIDRVHGFNHYPQIVSDVLKEECAQLLKDYFRSKRKGKRHEL